MKRSHLITGFWIATHALSIALGAIWMAMYQHQSPINEEEEHDKLLLGAKEVNNNKDDDNNKYFLVPILVLEHKWKGINLHQMILDTRARAMLPADENETTTRATAVVGPMHIYYPAAVASSVGVYLQDELKDFVRRKDVILKEVQGATVKRDAYVSLQVWTDLAIVAEKVLVVDEYAVLCSRPTHSIQWYAQRYDWIGAVWHWAKKDTPFVKGGNGALSIRNPNHLVVLLKGMEDIKKGNEDMRFVRLLGEWEQQGTPRDGVPAPKLATQGDQQSFAVETIKAPRDVTPIGVYHLMRIMDYKDREATIDKCPEAKRLFRPLHEGRCAVLECPKNMTPTFFQFKKRKEASDFDRCQELCDVVVHPVAVSNWTEG